VAALTPAVELAVDLAAGQSTTHRRRDAALGYVAILAVACAIAAYAIKLNHVYYQHGGPFYDSTSYLSGLSEVMARVHRFGFSTALQQQIGNSTVFMPWLQGMLLSYFCKPSRTTGILIQAVWLIALSLAVFRYFHSMRRYDAAAALALTLPFIAPACIFFVDGGLSDFRMDLLQYLTLSTGAVFFLSTYENQSKFNWIMSGLFLGISCLCRATSLVYIFITYAPLLGMRFLYSAERKSLIERFILLTVLLGITAAWFYVANASFLYYYYCVWNTDANAKLPLSLSILHAVCVFRDIGPAWFVFAILVGGISIAQWRKKRSNKKLSIHWAALWIGLVPCGFLILRGAGLNPFVSMPSVFGLMLFLSAPITTIRLHKRRLGISLLVISLCCAVVTAAPALKEHRKGFQSDGCPLVTMKAFRSAQDAILNDMRSRHLNTARFYVAHMAWVSSDTLLNSLIFDRGFTSDLDEGGGVIKAGLRLIPIARLSPATQLEWNSEFLKPGDSLTGIPLLVKECKDGVDYVILLTADSAERVAKEYKVNFINTKIIEIRNALLKTGQLSPVSDVIQDSPSEQFVVYRVTRKIQPN
jgi:hypothetical protein